MTAIANLRIKIFADGADLESMRALAARPYVRGFTTNPTLMQKAGVRDYRSFARQAVAAIPDRPISFEVFADDLEAMEQQALEIAAWGPFVYVKLPVTNTQGEPTFDLARRLSHSGVRVNVTAILTLEQVNAAVDALAGGAPSNVSVFAGRIADTGRDPMPLMASAAARVAGAPGVELIWASPRELLNLFQADAVGCDIITLPNDILAKVDLIGRDLGEFSLDTVRMFRRDAERAGLSL